MVKFTNPQEYKDKLNFFTHKNKGTIKNCYYMFDEAARLINEGHLFYEMTDDAFLLFKDENKFYHVSFIVAKNSKTRITADKLCTTGIAVKGEEKSEKIMQTEEAVERLGFTFQHCNRMYSIDIEESLANKKDEYIALEKQLKEHDFDLMHYNDAFFDIVKELWDSYLVAENIPYDDWNENIKESLLVFNSQNQDCGGVVMPKFQGNNNI